MIPLFYPLFQLLIIVLPFSSSSSMQEGPPIAKSGCPDQCGDVKIPYPFGVGTGCFDDAFYEIACNNNSKPFLQKYSLEVLNIAYNNVETNWPTMTVGIPVRNISGSDVGRSVNFSGSPYRFLPESNVLMAKGCTGHVVLKDMVWNVMTGCALFSANNSLSLLNSCNGVQCCQASLPYQGFISSFPGSEYYTFYEIALDQETTASSDTCTLVAGLIKRTEVEKYADASSHSSTFPVLLVWNSTFLTTEDELHYENFSCYLIKGNAWSCGCGDYYEGNPYLPNGCQAVRACNKCKHHCAYSLHYVPDLWRPSQHYYCVNPLLKPGPVLGFSLGMGLVVLLLCSYWLYRVIKKKREVKRKAKYFKRNGGLLLQQHMSSSEGAFENTKIFCTTELEKATNNFDKDRILGQGGQGTVYKGMLTDGKILAVKKSKLIDESQLESFINELVILSQINHRNVVKVLGCCLETEVPLLVYEFISNGTLYHLLHAPSDDFHVTWKMRLQIAAESADALVYLHSSSATPIYHRDIKSSNILLDEKYRAKVADFGTSKSITIEQTHVTTCVMGTYGYLDPEYFQSNQFTEKSDVYSFGVVLLELITGKKPICPDKFGGWISLAFEFLSYMENSRLFDILDARVLDEGKEEEFIAVANLARKCLNMSGKLRPSMKEIAVVLDGIRTRKLFSVKENLEEEVDETQFVVTEKSDVGHTSFKANTFSFVSPGSSRSINAEPLMPFTF